MIDTFSALLSPVILFFVLGAAAALARSDLAIPEAIAKGLALYLMAAIGLKGGVQVAQTGFTADMLLAGAAGLALSFVVPLPAYWLLRRLGRLDPLNAAAAAAHYGSVSVVTYVTGAEILGTAGMPPAGYMVAVLALMETPAIVVGLLLARRAGAGHHSGAELLRETLLNGSVVLLTGSFVIGLVAGPQGFMPIAPVFEAGFRGVLCLFLLDMGLAAARRLRQSNAITMRLVACAWLLPIANGVVGVSLAAALGLDAGSTAALGILAASASYIAVPAAMRLALPEADPGIYVPMSLALTFPFNILAGIPLFTALAKWMISP